MSLRLYNTRTRAVEEFKPQRDGEVKIYVCGMTPSAQAHLGHARSFLFFDVLRRYLKHLGYRVTYVQNVTDIDDRSIARGMETGEDWREIVAGYYADFKGSMEKLGVLPYDEEPYATQYIPQIQTMILELMEKGPRVRDGRRHLLSSQDVFKLRKARQPQHRGARVRRAHRSRRAEGRSARLCAVEVRQTRRTEVAVRTIRRRTPRLAYRVFRDVARTARPRRRRLRHPRRRSRPHLPAPRKRDRPKRAGDATSAHGAILAARRAAAVRQSQDEQIARELRADERFAETPRPAGGSPAVLADELFEGQELHRRVAGRSARRTRAAQSRVSDTASRRRRPQLRICTQPVTSRESNATSTTT